MKKQLIFMVIFLLLLVLSCSKRYVQEPLKIPDEMKDYPANIDKQGKDYVFRSGFYMWNREKQKYDYIPGEWVAQRNGYRWDPGTWQKTRYGYKYRPARWRKARTAAKPRVE